MSHTLFLGDSLVSFAPRDSTDLRSVPLDVCLVCSPSPDTASHPYFTLIPSGNPCLCTLQFYVISLSYTHSPFLAALLICALHLRRHRLHALGIPDIVLCIPVSHKELPTGLGRPSVFLKFEVGLNCLERSVIHGACARMLCDICWWGIPLGAPNG